MGQQPRFGRGQKLADPQHHLARIVPALSGPPQPQLFGKVGGRLPRQRRVGGAETLTLTPMAGGTGGQAAHRVAVMEEPQPGLGAGARAIERQSGVIYRHRLALPGVERLRDEVHFGMLAATVGIGFELPLKIAGVQSRQSRRTGAVPAPVEPVAGEAGIARARPGAAVGDHPAGLAEAVERSAVRCSAARQKGACREEEKSAHPAATATASRWFRMFALAPAVILSAACKPPPDRHQFMPMANAARGKAAIEHAGCGSCHTIPGLAWPQGKVGPKLDGLAERALIAGRLPNRPDVLAAYIRNAPSLAPGSGMPAMPVSEAQARDIAAYLYEQGTE